MHDIFILMNILKNNQNLKFNINSPKISYSKQAVIPNIIPTELTDRITITNTSTHNINNSKSQITLKKQKESKNINQDQLTQSPIITSNPNIIKPKNLNLKLSSQTKSSEKLQSSGSTYIVKHKDVDKSKEINKRQVEIRLKSRNMNNIIGNISNLEKENKSTILIKQKTVDGIDKKYKNHSPNKTPSPKQIQNMNNDIYQFPIIKKRAINNTRVINKGIKYKEKGNLTSNMTINKSDISSNNLSNISKSKSKSKIKDKSKSDASESTSVNKSRSKSKKNRISNISDISNNQNYVNSTNNFYSNNSKSPQSNNIIYNKKPSNSNYCLKPEIQKVPSHTPTTKKANLMIVHKKQSVSADKEEKNELFNDEYEEENQIIHAGLHLKNVNGNMISSEYNKNQNMNMNEQYEIKKNYNRKTINENNQNSNEVENENNKYKKSNAYINLKNNKYIKNQQSNERNSNKNNKERYNINESYREIDFNDKRNEKFQESMMNDDNFDNDSMKMNIKKEISNNLIKLNKNNKLDKEVLDEVLSEINNEIYSSKKTLSDKTDISDNNISILKTFEEIFGKRDDKKEEEYFRNDYINYSLSNNIKSGNSESLKDKIEKLKRLKNNHINL